LHFGERCSFSWFVLKGRRKLSFKRTIKKPKFLNIGGVRIRVFEQPQMFLVSIKDIHVFRKAVVALNQILFHNDLISY